jgi:hypothetical protein
MLGETLLVSLLIAAAQDGGEGAVETVALADGGRIERTVAERAGAVVLHGEWTRLDAAGARRAVGQSDHRHGNADSGRPVGPHRAGTASGDDGHPDAAQGPVPHAAPRPRRAGLTDDLIYWHFGALALHWMSAVDSKPWKLWSRALEDAALPAQREDGDSRGSWDAIGPWGFAGGRVYATALMVLTLQAAGAPIPERAR